jgi:RNA polymerase sigma factor (sigma-70 family)
MDPAPLRCAVESGGCRQQHVPPRTPRHGVHTEKGRASYAARAPGLRRSVVRVRFACTVIEGVLQRRDEEVGVPETRMSMVCDRDWQVPEELDGGYAATFGRLRALYRSRGLSKDDAADLAQEAIARALLHLRRHGCNGEPVTPLVNRIAANLLVDHLRANHSRVVSLEASEIDVDEPSADPSEEFARRHLRNEVRTAIAALPDRHQRVISMSLDGRTPAEIADDLGIRRNAADALLFRARRGLAELLRTAGAGAWAAAVLVALRVRHGARRGIDLARATPAAFLSTQPGVNLATAAIATVMAVGSVASSPAVAAAASRAPAQTPAVVVTTVTTQSETPTAVDAPSSAGGVVTNASVDARSHDVSVRGGGDSEDPAVRTWHNRDPDNRGVTGPVLDSATTTTCDLALAVCEAPGGSL